VTLDFTYTATATEVTITDYTGVGGAVVIPANINGTPVTAIGNYAFSSNPYGIQSITSLSIPDSVTSIGHDAFYYLRGLTNFEVDPNNLTYTSLGGVSCMIKIKRHSFNSQRADPAATRSPPA